MYESGLSSLKRAARFSTGHNTAILFILLIGILGAGANAIEPLLLKYLFDHLSPGQISRIVVAVLALLGIWILKEGMNAFCNWLTWKTRLEIHHSLLEQTVGRLQVMSFHVLRSEGVGALTTKLDRSIQGFLGGISQLLSSVLPAIVYLLISIIVMLKMNASLSLIVFFFAPLPVLIGGLTSPEQIRRERLMLRMWVRIYSRFTEVLSGILTVRTLVMEEAEKQRFLRDVAGANRLVLRGVQIDSTYSAISNLTALLARGVAIGYGAVLVIHQDISLGTLVAFLTYLSGFFGPVQNLSTSYQTLKRASVSMDEISSLLDMPEQIKDAPHAEDVREVMGEVVFDNVHFTYGVNDRVILENINFTAAPGEKVALVGPSGSGKTTLMALLQRFYDPIHGSIKIDNRDIRLLKQASLRKRFGVVLQDPLLFNDSVLNNIAYGRPEASFQEIVSAAKAAHAHDFIMKLPGGYDTIVGERGSALSVGERQRITIARAIVKNPAVVILDEATSALDAETEALVHDAVLHLIQGRTTFVIAHRLSTVVHVDRILVMKDGKIIETGKHTELVQKGGYYASLVDKQTRGLITHSPPTAA
ncbi:MAG: ABC transporter [Acidobacteria bacterium]|nr:MAG: ABC transporter [Acidobacteriota bacterium]